MGDDGAGEPFSRAGHAECTGTGRLADGHGPAVAPVQVLVMTGDRAGVPGVMIMMVLFMRIQWEMVTQFSGPARRRGQQTV